MLSVTPYGIPTTRTADLPYVIQMALESDDVDLAPTKIAVLVAPPEDTSTTSSSNSMIYKTYDLNVPLNGGEVIKAYGTNLIDGVTDPYFGCGVLISDQRTGKPQSYWTNPNAMNNYGTGNQSYVDGATYRFNNCERIVHVYSFVSVNTTRTITDSIGGTVKFSSPDFKTNLPQIYPFQVMFENDLAAGVNMVPTVLLWNVNIPTDPIVALTEALDNEGLASAGGVAWISGVGYNKTKKRV